MIDMTVRAIGPWSGTRTEAWRRKDAQRFRAKNADSFKSGGKFAKTDPKPKEPAP